jgi:hypothetical protein
MDKTRVMMLNVQSTLLKMGRQRFGTPAALDEDEALASLAHVSAHLFAEECWLRGRFSVPNNPPIQRNGAPVGPIPSPLKPFRELIGISDGSRKSQNATERIEPTESRKSSLQSRSAVRIVQEVNLIRNYKIHLWDPRPMLPPRSRTGIQSLRRHNEQLSVPKGDRVGLPRSPIVTSKDPNLEF